MSILTPEDLVVIKASLPDWLFPISEDVMNRRAPEIEREVTRFATPDYDGARPKLVDWLMQGLSWLGSSDFNFLWSVRAHEILTVDDVKYVVARRAQEILEDAIEEYDEGAEAYLIRHTNQGKPSAENHPWGLKEREIYHLWLTATPYTVWSIYNKVRESSRDYLDDSLLDFVTSRSYGTGLADAAAKRYGEAMVQWKNSVRPIRA